MVGVSGTPGSYSELAAETHIKKTNLHARIDYRTSVEKALEALENREVARAIFPVRNSTLPRGGLVLEAIKAMGRYRFDYEDHLEILVRHNLLGLSGMKPEDVQLIVSQEPALDQCVAYLKCEWRKGIPRQLHADTALAAQDLSEGKFPPGTAVIASQRAAKLHRLAFLDRNIQDVSDNRTTFIVARSIGNVQ